MVLPLRRLLIYQIIQKELIIRSLMVSTLLKDYKGVCEEAGAASATSYMRGLHHLIILIIILGDIPGLKNRVPCSSVSYRTPFTDNYGGRVWFFSQSQTSVFWIECKLTEYANFVCMSN
ncbi:hypothetical protein CEXT_93361 [Caerostris extrusa]|uniref:Uncharacterized protein n=1 Tax=Caerostris extrusa TaxID=172846 RepID=A0AAV4VKX9_CAEEX|nr:hypothetical protein CEXT_93361 [Caerostris extrusa]